MCFVIVCVCTLALLLHNHRTGQLNTEGYNPHIQSLSTWVCVGQRTVGLAEIWSRQRVSHLRLFLVVCPRGVLCLDALTTRSCEVTTFQPAAFLSESQLYSCSLACLQVWNETPPKSGCAVLLILLKVCSDTLTTTVDVSDTKCVGRTSQWQPVFSGISAAELEKRKKYKFVAAPVWESLCPRRDSSSWSSNITWKQPPLFCHHWGNGRGTLTHFHKSRSCLRQESKPSL